MASHIPLRPADEKMGTHFFIFADFLASLQLADRKSERNENFLSNRKRFFENFLLAPYMPPLRILF